MRKSRRQRGESNAGCLFGLIILAVVAYFAYKMIPAKIKTADLSPLNSLMDQKTYDSKHPVGK